MSTVRALLTRVPHLLTVSTARDTGVLLVLSVLFPFLIHLLPVPPDVRLGPRLLPMFYAPLLGVLMGRASSAALAAVLAPWVNHVITGHPSPRTCVMMALQMATFVVVLRLLLSRFGRRWYLAAPAYLACMLVAAAVGALRPELIGGAPPAGWLVRVVWMGLPGVGVFLLISWLAIALSQDEHDGPRTPSV